MKKSIFESFDRVLLLGPHPDDIEFSSGGTVSKMLEYGIDVHYAVFSMCEKSVPKGMPSDIIKQELIKSSEFLGIKNNLYLYNYEVRCLPEKRQEILEDLVKLKEKIEPELIFVPSSHDVHQDHKTIYEEGLRAFKYSNIIGYEMPWNNFSSNYNLYIPLDESNIRKKIDALKFYKSQDFRSYNNEDLILSLAKVRGMQIKEKFAEAFEVIRMKFK
ncbi:MAG: PIG-L family deacetylase [Bacteroidota bacterium]|nr:PIG-L family deacetylase [Bacteroidota bacterium]